MDDDKAKLIWQVALGILFGLSALAFVLALSIK